jgi:hypothetical protein
MMVMKSRLPVPIPRMRIPIKKPRSAKRVTIKAFLDAATAEGLLK